MSELSKLAGAAAIELVNRELGKGLNRIFVVVAVEPQPDGSCAVASGIGYPEDMPIASDAARLILEAALSLIDGAGVPAAKKDVQLS